METTMTAFEMTGTIDEHRQLQLDDALPFPGPARVRVIVLYPSSKEWDDMEWLKAAARNPAFEFLKDPKEDIYSLEDGSPFHTSTAPSDDGQDEPDSKRIRPIAFKNPAADQTTTS